MENSSSVNIGIIGCGAIVQAVHLNVLGSIAGAKVVALAEADDARRQQACAKVVGAKEYSDWRELLGDSHVNAVVIALPTGMHAEVAEATLAAGKHVYLEKPLAANVEDGRRVVEAWERQKLVGMIGFNYRFNPLYAEIKRQIDTGRVDQAICVRSVFSTRAGIQPNWKKSRAGGGGVLLDLGSHHFDLMRYMFGEIDQVQARIASVQSEDDTATVSLRMAGSVLCESLFSLASVEEDRIEVYGREGKIWADRYRSASVQFEPASRGADLLKGISRAIMEIPATLQKIARRGAELSYGNALTRFVEAVRAGTSTTPDFRDGLRSLEIVEAAGGIGPTNGEGGNMTSAPLLSVIIGSPTDDLSYVMTMMRCIARQSIADQIEMIVVSAPTAQVIPADEIRPFLDVKTVQIPVIKVWGDVMFAGIALATGNIIVLAEDHAFPESGWAQALINAHQQGHQVVGPVVANANGHTGQSNTHWMMDYGRWMVGNASGERDDVPGHNTSYRRELLAQFSPEELSRYLQPGGGLHGQLKRRGAKLHLAGEAIVWHTHPSRIPLSIFLRFNNGRMIGACRVRDLGWKLPRRVLYALAAPLLLLMRLRYVLQSLALAGQWKLLLRPRVLAWLAVGLISGAIGEAWGYLSGFGSIIEEMGLEEFHKFPQITASDVDQLKSRWGSSDLQNTKPPQSIPTMRPV